MRPVSLISKAHALAGSRLGPGDIAVDATVGNGRDTLFLLRKVAPTGRVYGFDIQTEALAAAQTNITEDALIRCLTLFPASHALMGELIPIGDHERIRACMFNLGYLPHGDKRIVTTPESTLAALNAACGLLAEGGLITVIAYPGHAGGDVETGRVAGWCERLDRRRYGVGTVCSGTANNKAPRLFVIEKLC